MFMMVLVNFVYDCFFWLVQLDSLSKEEEVDCLVLQLYWVGEQLEKMNGQCMDEFFVLIWDGFLFLIGFSFLVQLLLLEIIEFWVVGWKIMLVVYKYYYSEVFDQVFRLGFFYQYWFFFYLFLKLVVEFLFYLKIFFFQILSVFFFRFFYFLVRCFLFMLWFCFEFFFLL